MLEHSTVMMRTIYLHDLPGPSFEEKSELKKMIFSIHFSSRMTASWPFPAARCSGVWPFPSLASFSAARCSGVWPLLSLASFSAWAFSMRYLAAPIFGLLLGLGFFDEVLDDGRIAVLGGKVQRRLAAFILGLLLGLGFFDEVFDDGR